MTEDERLISDRFPRASRYHPEWVLASCSSAANALWLTEWLAQALDLRPGMRVLDIGCGRAMSSIFLRREFGVQVWAADLWFNPSENLQRIRDAGVEDGVFPIHADARQLPFAAEFFAAVVAIDSYYYGTDDLYLGYLARLVKPGGPIGIAGAGLMQEVNGAIPAHLSEWWTQDQPWCFHSADWWRRHWDRTGIVDVEVADTLPDGWRLWLDWWSPPTTRRRFRRWRVTPAVTSVTCVSSAGARPSRSCRSRSCLCPLNTTRGRCFAARSKPPETDDEANG